MTRSFLLLILINGLLFYGMAVLNVTILTLALPLLIYLGVAYFRQGQPATLHVTRQFSRQTLHAGGRTDITVGLRNDGNEPIEVAVRDLTGAQFDVVDGSPQGVAVLGAGEATTLTYTVMAERGIFEAADVQLIFAEPFDLFRRVTVQAFETPLVVMPDFPRMRRLPIRPINTFGFTGPIGSRRSGSGVDFFGVRPYRLGDPLHRINWRATARHDDIPYTVEFEQDQIADVGIVLDGRAQHVFYNGADSLLDHGISAAASMADVLLREGHRVGLLLYGRGRWVFPGHGRSQRERILRTLASAEPAPTAIFDNLNHLPTKLFPAGSQLIFVTPLLPDDENTLINVRALGYSVIVVSPDPVRYEIERMPERPMVGYAIRLARLERQLQIKRLRQSGIVVVDWDVNSSLEEQLVAMLQRTPPARYIRERML